MRDRSDVIAEIRGVNEPWDMLIIGGGATGIGTALDSASRGFRTLLLEQHDFGKGTSSRSTKLVHGGVRYLRQGDVSLVFEALKERGLMLQNAPHLVRNQSFVIPAYDWWEGPFYTVGLKVYDMMAGKMGLGPSRLISREETIELLPTIEKKGLKGGIIYHDGQFDDARMLISLAQTCEDHNGFLVNYFRVVDLVKEKGLVSGVMAVDQETGEEFHIAARAIINATGVFADDILRMDDPETGNMIRPSQGIHLVLNNTFLQGRYAIMVPQTSDGRVMFAVPWYDKVVVGTTDTLVDNASLEPKPLVEEIDFVLSTTGQYLVNDPNREDVLSVFAGLRPLAVSGDNDKSTKEISRHHKVMVSVTGLISVIGGKWTTYRKMAEDAVDYAIMVGDLAERKCLTHHLPVHGYMRTTKTPISPMSVYGQDKTLIEDISHASFGNDPYLSKSLGIYKAQVTWAVREEMARTLEDVLARRTRALFLDAKESLRIAPEAARFMATELNQDHHWIASQLKHFNQLVQSYLIDLS
ncbi:MAG: FAD-dependent oxidoreductase [Bacteroides sp. SM1_62]|nr:MAG: FAD-dependent oxidoreductase [Bacteroides sp. SM23_62]KPL26693.1 MAG: FAD-dependent oxidoreductase [Bacteroides sp. SM1_62]